MCTCRWRTAGCSRWSRRLLAISPLTTTMGRLESGWRRGIRIRGRRSCTATEKDSNPCDVDPCSETAWSLEASTRILAQAPCAHKRAAFIGQDCRPGGGVHGPLPRPCVDCQCHDAGLGVDCSRIFDSNSAGLGAVMVLSRCGSRSKVSSDASISNETSICAALAHAVSPHSASGEDWPCHRCALAFGADVLAQVLR